VTKIKDTATAPKLRFPEFVGQVQREVPLREVTTESKIRNGYGLPVGAAMGVSKTLGIVPMEARVVGSDITRYKLVKKSWFAYNPMRLNIGSIARWNGDSDILVSPDYVVFRCLNDSESGISPDYLDQFRQSVVWDNFVSQGGDGGVRVRIYYKDLARLKLILPKPAEQQKIADFLVSLDELIAAQEQKVKVLKTYKRGLMQRLFPREGETLPRLRFPEFTSTSSWHAQKIVSLLSKASFSVSVDPEKMYREIGIRSHGKGIFHKEPALGKAIGEKRVFEVVQDALVLNIVFAWEQAVATTSEKEVEMIASHRFPMYVAKPGKCDVEYIKWFFLTKEGKRLLGMASPGGAGRNKTLGQKHFESLEVTLPASVDEQTRIANCLSSFAARITAETEQLSVLKTQKMGLMQHLFPAPEEIKA
jgi:type I restriction enzyme S subunit